MQKFILEKEVNILKYYLNSNMQQSYNGGNYEIHKETCQYYYKYKSSPHPDTNPAYSRCSKTQTCRYATTTWKSRNGNPAGYVSPGHPPP